MKKIFTVILLSLFLSSCGATDRFFASMTGNGSETCVDGVLYLQFTSGVSVKYLPNGMIATCKN